MPVESELFTPGGIFAPPRGPVEREPAWIDASPHRPAAKPGTGQMPLFPESGTLPTWTKVVSGLGLMGLLYSMDHWARPTLKASKLVRRRGVWGLLQSVVDSLTEFLQHGTNYIGHEVSKGAAHAAHGPAYTIGLGADRWNQLVWNVAYMQLENEQVTRRLVHHVIPRQINAQTRPLRARTRKLEKGQATQTRKTNALRHWTHTEIVRDIKPKIHHLERVTTKTLPQRIHREEIKRGKLETKVKRDHKLLMKLLPLLTVAGAVGLVAKALTRMGLNFMRCENVKDVGRDICASPPGSGRRLGRFLKNILSMGAGILFISQFCRVLFLVLEGAAPVASKFVETLAVAESALCDGKYAAAPPLPLNVTALPPVLNPLEI